ncbi:unnamed protein product, partial [Chrysoparadoxa australica]
LALFEPPSISLNERIYLDVDKSVLERSGETVVISYSNVPWYYLGCMIAVYSPAQGIQSEEALAATSPIKYRNLGDATDEFGKSNWFNTRGQVSMNLLNLRDEAGYSVGLFRNGLKSPVLVAELPGAIRFSDPKTEILHQHLALTGDSTEMRVSWVMGAEMRKGVMRVQYGEEGSSEMMEAAAGRPHTYGRADMCGDIASSSGFHDPGLHYTAVMTSLTPGRRYWYQVTAGLNGGPGGGLMPAGARASFLAPPPPGAPVKFSMFADMGTAEADGSRDAGHWMEAPALRTTESVARLMSDAYTEQPIGMVMHVGDIAYSRGFASQWDEFMTMIQPVATQIPWMVGVGNHERDSGDDTLNHARTGKSYFMGGDSGGECGVPYSTYFRMPAPADDPKQDTPWYSLNYGVVHLLVMSTEHDYQPGSEQYSFLQQDLEAVDRSVTPWIVFTGHRPMYVDSTGMGAEDCHPATRDGVPCGNDQPGAADLRKNLEPLLLKHQVDLCVWGHHHTYQRTCPIANNKCVHAEKGVDSRGQYLAPVHIVAGMAG